MNIYRNCIAIRSGVMPVHTLIVDGEKIHVNHMNNLNKQCLLDNLRKDNYIHYATAYDTDGNIYALYSNCKYKLAIIDECVKPLTIADPYEYNDHRNGYNIYRAIIDGKGHWKAIKADGSTGIETGEPFTITYEQAIGMEPLDSEQAMRMYLGRVLLTKE